MLSEVGEVIALELLSTDKDLSDNTLKLADHSAGRSSGVKRQKGSGLIFDDGVTVLVAAGCAVALGLSARFALRARRDWRSPGEDRHGERGGRSLVSAAWAAACQFAALSLAVVLAV